MNYRLQDLLMNPSLDGVLPQFTKGESLQNVYSFAKIDRKVIEYLKKALNGTISGDNELVVRGQARQVLRQVRQLQGNLESFYNSMPSLNRNLRANTKVYIPFTLGQLKDMKTPSQKQKAIKALLDNINYNPDFNSENSLSNISTVPFGRRQAEWKRQVKYKETR